jgi:hypothetical protein
MTITEARQELEAGIAAAGLRIGEPAAGRIALPCVVIVGAEPWFVPAQLGAGIGQVTLDAVGLIALVSDTIAMQALEAMALDLARAIRELPDWTAPTVHRPGTTPAAGQVYQSVRVTTSRRITT